MKKMNPVVHFEMPYDNPKRMAKFYQSAFGWKTQQLGKEMGDYVLAGTTETDANNMIKTPGNINGGFPNAELMKTISSLLAGASRKRKSPT